jgi:hypothetical protein
MAGDWQATAREGFGSPQWSDNVTRMHLFMREHPEVRITTPVENGTREFIAAQDGGLLAADTSLGWLMDKLEQHYRRPGG